MNVVAIIHARGGSKRIPLKNIRPLAGKPLISYVIEAALNAKTVNRVIVSTDHPDIITIAKGCGAEVPFVRPADISEDVPSELVTQHAVRYLEEIENYPVEIAVTMQPTTPFCVPGDVDSCVELILNSDADSAVTACQIHERPESMFYLGKDSYAVNFLGNTMTGDIGVSQALPKLYTPNGGVYATRRKSLFDQNSLYGKKVKLHIVPRERSVDIDEPIDFAIAEFLANSQKKEAYHEKIVKRKLQVE